MTEAANPVPILATYARAQMDTYASFVFEHTPAAIHDSWYHEIGLTIAGKNTHRNLLITAPPNSAKSTVTAHVLPAFYLGQHPDHHLMYLTASDSMANTRLSVVRNILEHSPKHQLVFPDAGARPNKDRGWSTDGLYLQGTSPRDADPAYRATGMLSNILGGRANGIIIDDPLTQRESLSDIDLATAKQLFLGTVRTRLPPDGTGWMVAIMTRWVEGDFASFLKDLGDWKVLNYPALGKYPWGRSIWPARFLIEELEAERRRDPATFQCLMMGDPTSMGGLIFQQRKWFKPLPEDYDRPSPSGKSMRQALPIVQCWDLAYSKSQTADFTVALTGQIDAVGAVYVLNRLKVQVQALGAGFGADEEDIEIAEKQDDKMGLAATMARHIAQTRPALVGIPLDAYRTNYCRRLIQRVSRLLRRAGVATVIKPITVDKDKVTRAKTAASVAESGDMYVDLDAEWSPDFLNQLVGFPNRQHDDDVDALSGLVLLSIQEADWLEKAGATYGFAPLDETIESDDAPAWDPFGEHDRAVAEAKTPLLVATDGRLR